MASDIGFFLLGILLLLLGGDSALRGVSGLAQRLGASPVVAGLLMVVFASSIPEIVVNTYAIAAGQPDLALGNAVGSNVVNIGLTLGIAALVAPLLATMRLLAVEVVLVLVATGAVLLFGLDGTLARWEGGVLLAGFAAFLVLAFRRLRGEAASVHQELTAHATTSANFAQNLVRLVLAGIVLFFGSKLVVQHALPIGLALGMGSMLTGLVVVAIGTAIPEFVIAGLAAARGQGNVVVGAALGACLVNLLLVVGGMAAWHPLALPASFLRLELPAAMAFALLLYPVLGGDLDIRRREGLVLVLAFGGWLAFQLLASLG
jgi:cation:H+ antiporter